MHKFFKVYSGKANRCCCGCSGKWSVTKEASANHPYSTVSDRSVKLIVNKIFNSGRAVLEGDHYYAEFNNRLYIAFFEEGVA